ncbi:L-threonylcarbamoyladenylate synthase [Planctomonas psychrotolerans]|uniref:L-threonylcarbamoyladenylate synthase n=1 Tax=Planctomonas psychrotolerans TaxID=2528712 RepID=UPI0012390691|nr:L-threonylcarbamoyladenylate synthase [Planctomonas psychrotolerans]
MARIYDCSVDSELLTGMRLARAAIARGECVVLPTDTVYGIAVDAFNPDAVQRLLDAKGRTRTSPPPVLIPGVPTLDALAETVHPLVRELVDRFWPGALTIIMRAQPSLSWDLGETRGTVALRMPDNPLMLELLTEVGPLAVSSANRTGEPSATSAIEASEQLGDTVTVYLDGGDSPESRLASTIIDATGLRAGGGTITIVRQGAISREDIRSVVGDVLEDEG